MAKKHPKPKTDEIETHLSMMQSVIQRMAANSSACKAWCITLVSALLVVILDKSKPQFLPIAIIPALLFLMLDTYYLVLEKLFRNSYNAFVKKVHERTVHATDLYHIAFAGDWKIETRMALKSIAIWPFYVSMIAFIAIAFWIGGGPIIRQ